MLQVIPTLTAEDFKTAHRVSFANRLEIKFISLVNLEQFQPEQIAGGQVSTSSICREILWHRLP